MQKSVSLEELAKVLCEVSGIQMESLLGHENRSLPNMVRGVFLMLSKEFGFRVTEICAFVGRSHASCIVTANRYKGYYETKDKQVCEIVKKVKKALNE